MLKLKFLQLLASILFPLAVPQGLEAFEACNLQQIYPQVQKLLVSASGAVCMLEGSNDKSILLVVHKIASEVINHDCIVWGIVVGELSPQEGKGLAFKEACMQQTKNESFTEMSAKERSKLDSFGLP